MARSATTAGRRGGADCDIRTRRGRRGWGCRLPFLPALALIIGLLWAGRRLTRARRQAERPGT